MGIIEKDVCDVRTEHINKELKGITNTLKEISSVQIKHHITLERNTTSLEHHIKRTNLLEDNQQTYNKQLIETNSELKDIKLQQVEHSKVITLLTPSFKKFRYLLYIITGPVSAYLLLQQLK